MMTQIDLAGLTVSVTTTQFCHCSVISSHRQYVNKWTWLLSSNKVLFVKKKMVACNFLDPCTSMFSPDLISLTLLTIASLVYLWFSSPSWQSYSECLIICPPLLKCGPENKAHSPWMWWCHILSCCVSSRSNCYPCKLQPCENLVRHLWEACKTTHPWAGRKETRDMTCQAWT